MLGFVPLSRVMETMVRSCLYSHKFGARKHGLLLARAFQVGSEGVGDGVKQSQSSCVRDCLLSSFAKHQIPAYNTNDLHQYIRLVIPRVT